MYFDFRKGLFHFLNFRIYYLQTIILDTRSVPGNNGRMVSFMVFKPPSKKNVWGFHEHVKRRVSIFRNLNLKKLTHQAIED